MSAKQTVGDIKKNIFTNLYEIYFLEFIFKYFPYAG